jgi:glycerophosphoryl diester phosphodiesterase
VPVLAGHRGIGNPWTVILGIPEESIPAILYAAAHHADILEGDVSVTSDNKMVMMHDESLDRTTNRDGLVRLHSLGYITEAFLEIVGIDNNHNNNPDNTKWHPPSAKAWLTAAKQTGKQVFMELKGSGWSMSQVGRYNRMLHDLGMTGRVITAGSETKLTYFKTFNAAGKRSWGVSTYPKVTKVKAVVGAGGYATMRLIEAEANPSYVKALQAAGVRVFLWTLDNAGHYERALKLNAYGWFCDNTDDAWNWLQERA